MIKTFYYKLIKLSRLKNLEIQFYLSEMYFSGIDFDLKLFTDKFIFLFGIDLYLINICLSYNRRSDHAGIGLEIRVLNSTFDFRTYDVRHWDDENNKWEEFN